MGGALALLASLRWKDLPETNGLAYFRAFVNYRHEQLVPGPVLQHFFVRNLRIFVIS
jgi:hypothetical protein